MTIDVNTVWGVLNRAKNTLSRPGAPIYLNHEQAKAWRDGFQFCIETFFQTALAVTRDMAAEEQAREDRAAVADPSYDRIDHLLYREERWGLSPAEAREVREDHKRLRAVEKARHRAKIDPTRQIVVFHGEPTVKADPPPYPEWKPGIELEAVQEVAQKYPDVNRPIGQ